MIRTFTATTLSDALRRARSEAGPSAVVLDVRRGASQVEIAVRTPDPAAPAPVPVAAPAAVAVAEPPAPASDPLRRKLRALGFKGARCASLLEDLRPGPDRRSAVRRRIERLLPQDVPERVRTLALVGPTGVGKTTTIAKLAGRARLAGKTVGLVAADSYRMAAVDHLAAYAQLLGAPLEVASSPSELATAVARLADRDLILIDTAGQSPADEERSAALVKTLAAVRQLSTYLVLAAPTRLAELRTAQRRFQACGPDGLVLTKLDETVVTGDVLELLAKLTVPLRWVCAGQDVAADLAAPDPERLSRWLMGEGL